jgi:hypothetical protein
MNLSHQIKTNIYKQNITMSDFNYIEYLKNNPLLKGEKTQSTKLITEAQEAPKSAKMKVSELKAKIREEILSTLNEEDYSVADREVEYGIRPGSEEDELSMQDIFDMLDNEEFEDMEDMPLDEAKEDEEEAPAEEEEMDAEVDVDVEAAPASGLSAEEQEIQNSLKIAYDNAAAIGDQKLADQIGNSITFFTRTHVVER